MASVRSREDSQQFSCVSCRIDLILAHDEVDQLLPPQGANEGARRDGAAERLLQDEIQQKPRRTQHLGPR